MPTAAEYEANKNKSEAELRARLGAAPDAEPGSAEQPTGKPLPPRNPYTVTLVVLASACALVSLILYILSANTVDSPGVAGGDAQTVAAAFGTVWLGFAILFILAFLILGSLKWKASGGGRD